MTEADWLGGSNPESMLSFLGETGGSKRQWRLFAAACLREVGHLLLDQRARAAFLALEAFADGRRSHLELKAAHVTAVSAHRYLLSSAFPRDSYDRHLLPRIEAAHAALVLATRPSPEAFIQAAAVYRLLRNVDRDLDRRRLGKTQCDLLRDQFGNPFRPVRLPKKWLRTTGQQAALIARAIYEDRSFDELGILADALVDADCPCPELIRHCREAMPHGRGCWAVERLLSGPGTGAAGGQPWPGA
jgi:hypothetical protein